MSRTQTNNPMQSILLSDNKELKITVLPFGAIIKSIQFRQQEMTLTVDDPTYYQENPFYLGATVGRYANRIAGGQFKLGDSVYQLAQNNGPNSLHGGVEGFNKVLWQVVEQSDESVTLFYRAQDNEQGFPGNLDVYQHISVNNGQLKMHFTASSDAETVINLTNHCYFNLAQSSSILDHVLQVNSDYFLAVDENAIPLAQPESVQNTCFDFSQATRIGDALIGSHQQLERGNGFDHCYIFKNDNKCKPLATLSSPESGISLTVLSTQPGLQVYSGNYLAAPFTARQGICLEAQNWPDAPNRDDFPTARLTAGEQYQQTIVYAFS